MTEVEHRARHLELHRMLDELLADFLRHEDTATRHNDGLPILTKRPILDLLTWSYEQTLHPTPGGEEPADAS